MRSSPERSPPRTSSVETRSISDRQHVAYQLRIANADGDFVVEQQAYFSADDEKIDYIRILCSGFRPAQARS